MASKSTEWETVNNRTDWFRRRVLTAVFIAVTVVGLLLFLYGTAEVLLLLFISILLAVALRTTSHWLHTHMALSENLALVVVCLGVSLVVILFGFLIGPRLVQQFDQLAQQLPESLTTLESQLSQTPLGSQLLDQLPDNLTWSSVLDSGGQSQNWFARVTGVVSATVGVIANLVLVLFTTLFFAIEPQTYINGVAQLVPPERRDRTRQVLEAVGDTLWKWLVSRFISMLLIGVLSTVGLALLSVPLALTLGIIAGLMAFIPMIGPIIALIPAVLVALLQSPQTALWVLLLYLGIQSIDNYIFTPIVVKRTMRMPPALVIVAQLLAGVVFGQLGLVLAAPLAAAGMTLVKQVYVRDFLEGSRPDGSTHSN